MRLTVTTLDFTYANEGGDSGQIARIDATGTYAPDTKTMTLHGRLGFLPLKADAQSADALSKAPTTVGLKLVGERVDLPKAP